MRRTGPTNIVLRKLADEIERTGKREGAKVWIRVAELLRKPTRERVEVNLSKINRHANEGEMIIVPGKVLGSGVLTKKVTVAAYAFSEQALKKIKAAGAEAITLAEAVRRNPSGSKTRIII